MTPCVQGRMQQIYRSVSWFLLRLFAAGDEGVGVLFEKVEKHGQGLHSAGKLVQGSVEIVGQRCVRREQDPKILGGAAKLSQGLIGFRQGVGDAVGQRVNAAVEFLTQQAVLVQGRLQGGQVVCDLW